MAKGELPFFSLDVVRAIEVGRHVEITLKIDHMAFGYNVHWFMKWITRWASCWRLQSRIMAKGKVPRKLGTMLRMTISQAQGFRV